MRGRGDLKAEPGGARAPLTACPMLSIPPDSNRLNSARSGWAPGGVSARGIWWPAAGGEKAHRPSVSQDDPRRPRLEIRGGREVQRDATDTL